MLGLREHTTKEGNYCMQKSLLQYRMVVLISKEFGKLENKLIYAKPEKVLRIKL
jgi:hypothetical protein